MTSGQAAGIVEFMMGHGAPVLTARRDAGHGNTGMGGEAADLIAVQALEARKALLAGAVAALAAPDSRAAELFEAALAQPGGWWWPFDLARVHLLYGEWLRRSRQITWRGIISKRPSRPLSGWAHPPGPTGPRPNWPQRPRSGSGLASRSR
jgi:hypothetical protein